ncbi:MAG: glycosyl transferase [Microbacteriaceae bacterium]|jgi:ADP-heptose:LPS heptosyltransferase|nr:glycosyl transferase [Microbacteriaceae bacterium]
MRRALVARLDSAGDVLLAGPAVRAIAAHPDVGELVLLCGPQGAPAGALLPGVGRVIVWACPWIADPSPAATPEHVGVLSALLGDPPDIAVLLTSFHQSPLPLALLLRLAGVPRIIGASVDAAGSLLDVRIRPGEDFPEELPEAERAMTIVRAGGFELPGRDDGRLRVLPTPDVSALVGTESYVVIHPGASVPARAWPEENAADLVRLLTGAGHRVVVTGGPSERALTARVAGTDGMDLGGRTDLHELSGVLAGARLLVTGNTGPAHLAAAVGTPVVSLFSPVVPAAKWAPYRVPVEVLGDQRAECAGTRARECPVPGHPCLSSVSAGVAFAACGKLLARTSCDAEPAPRVEVPA